MNRAPAPTGTRRTNGRGFLGVLAALGTQRIIELGWSARNLGASGPGRRASPGTYPLMVAVNIALFTLPGIRRYGRPHPPPAVHAAAAAGLTAATGLRLWAIATLGRHWNVRASVPTTMIPARGGPYRWVRHPNYVAVAIEFLTVPLLGGGYLEAAALSSANAAVLWPRIRAEEALLDTIPAYRRAFLGTPRFVPRVITRRRATASRGPTGGRIPSTRS